MERTLTNTNPEQATKSGWVVDKGDPGAWECLSKAHHDASGTMKSTKRMAVQGGWIYLVTTEVRERDQHGNTTHLAVAEALTFVPESG